jgi:HTH-type transcriptional regulator / antitoxin HipB
MIRTIVRISLDIRPVEPRSSVNTHEHAYQRGKAARMPSEWEDTHERADLAQVVRGRRRQLDLRQEDLADLAGVSLRFVQALEAGKLTVQLDRVEAVLAVLGLRLRVERVRG